VVSIVPKVAAYVSKLHVNDNSKLGRDDLLLELDPRDFRVAVDIAKADLKSAEANAGNIEAQLSPGIEATCVRSRSWCTMDEWARYLDWQRLSGICDRK
jgi:multidrug resistance efflux pump